MSKKGVLAGLIIGACAWSLADMPGDFQASLALYKNKNYQKAHDAFVKAESIAPTKKSKSECLAYAALSLAKLKRYDEALALARTIKVKPISVNCQMEIMLDNQKCQELIDAFKEEDVAAWPDYIIHKGFYNRGLAYSRTRGNTEAAASDLEKAVEHSDTTGYFQARALTDLGRIYRGLKRDDEALAAYRRSLAIGLNGLHTHFTSGMNAATILMEQGKHGEALVELKKLDPLPSKGIYRARVLELRGDAFAGQGRIDDALAKYAEVVEIEGLSQKHIDKIKAKIDKIKGTQ